MNFATVSAAASLYFVCGGQDVDQRLTRDIERLCNDLSALIPSMVKPVVDILWCGSQWLFFGLACFQIPGML